MNAIQVNHLRKTYQTHVAVDDVSFTVPEGELFAYLGENGAGKSTTINMLSTVLKKTSGEAFVFGHELGSEDARIRDVIGIVFQKSVLDPKLTVSENLLTRGSYYGFSKKETMKKLEPFWDTFLLDEIWKQPYQKLSGGQRRRVDVIRALIHHPKLLFLDEPTTGLDPATRKLLWDYLSDLRKKEALTIFLTTHYMEEAAQADHVVILDHGRVIADGTPANLKTTYARSKLLWYHAPSENADALLQDFEHVYQTDHYVAYFDGAITDFLCDNKTEIEDYEILKGTMDDVFLTLTGKELENA